MKNTIKFLTVAAFMTIATQSHAMLRLFAHRSQAKAANIVKPMATIMNTNRIVRSASQIVRTLNSSSNNQHKSSSESNFGKQKSVPQYSKARLALTGLGLTAAGIALYNQPAQAEKKSENEPKQVWSIHKILNPTVIKDVPHYYRIKLAQISPNGEQIVTVGEGETEGWKNSTVKIWDIKTGKALINLLYAKQINSAAFSPDNKHILICFFHKLRILNAQTGKIQTLNLENPVKTAHFSPDSKQIVTSTNWNGKKVQIWDIQTGKLKTTLDCANKFNLDEIRTIESAQFNPDSTQIIIQLSNRLIKIWNPQTDEVQEDRNVEKYEKLFNSSISSDGKYHVCAGFGSHRAPIFDTQSRKVAELMHDSNVESASFGFNGQHIVTVCQDGTARIWKTENVA